MSSIPLSSSLTGTKLALSCPLSYKSRGHCRFNTVSCRATNLAREKGATDFYQVLSLDSGNADVDEIKRAYRALALRYHPDVCHPSNKEKSTRMFVQLHRAYKTLSDPVSRKKYDSWLSIGGFGRNTATAMEGGLSGLSGERWEEQLHELKRRSDARKTQTGGSWSSRLRAKRK